MYKCTLWAHLMCWKWKRTCANLWVPFFSCRFSIFIVIRCLVESGLHCMYGDETKKERNYISEQQQHRHAIPVVSWLATFYFYHSSYTISNNNIKYLFRETYTERARLNDRMVAARTCTVCVNERTSGRPGDRLSNRIIRETVKVGERNRKYAQQCGYNRASSFFSVALALALALALTLTHSFKQHGTMIQSQRII